MDAERIASAGSTELIMTFIVDSLGSVTRSSCLARTEMRCAWPQLLNAAEH